MSAGILVTKRSGRESDLYIRQKCTFSLSLSVFQSSLSLGCDHFGLFRSSSSSVFPAFEKVYKTGVCIGLTTMNHLAVCVCTQSKILLLSSIDSTCPVHCVGAPARVVFLQMWLNLYPCKRACLCPLHRSPALFKLSAGVRSPMLLFSCALERHRATLEYWAGESSRPGQRMQRREGNKWRWYLWFGRISSSLQLR